VSFGYLVHITNAIVAKSMICNFCLLDFTPTHFNQRLCSAKCKGDARERALKKYNNSDKKRAAALRYIRKPEKKERIKLYLKEYSQRPQSKKLAARRSLRNLKGNPKLLRAKRQRDVLFGRSERGREINKISAARYRKTEKAREVRLANKAARRVAYRERFSVHEWLALKAKYGGCANCRNPKVEVDHIVPITKGGRNTIDNIQPLCRSCNSSKGRRVIRYELPKMQQTTHQ